MISVLLTSAWAFDLQATNWSWQEDPYAAPIVLDPASFPDDVGSEADIEAALREGLVAWNGVAAVELMVSDVASATSTSGDMRTVIRWDPSASAGSVVATASVWGSGASSYDCDVAFWGSNDDGPVDWRLVPGPGVDLTETMTHEMGHCLGLDHSDIDEASMAANLRGFRGLHDDDRSGLRAMYPLTSDSDGDGASEDCDDGDADVHPGAVEVCDGIDNNCDGAVDTESFADFEFAGASHWTSTGTVRSWHGVYEVQRDTALHTFSQHVELTEDQFVTFAVLDITDAVAVRTIHTEFHTAGTTLLESPVFDLPLHAGRTYAIGVGTLGSSRFAFQPTSPDAGGLHPVGNRWTGFVPTDAGPFPVHSDNVPHVTLRLAEVDVDGDGVTAFCGDCDDRDPDATLPSDCVAEPEPEPEPESGGGCGGNITAFFLGLSRSR